MPLAGYIPIGDKVISSNVLVPIKSCALLLIANPINAAHTPFPQFATYVEKYFIRGNCCVRCFVIMIPRLVKKKERKKKVKNCETIIHREFDLTHVRRRRETRNANFFQLSLVPLIPSHCTNVYNRSQCLDIKRRSRNVAMAGRAATNEFSPKDSSFRERITHRKLNSKRWRAAIKLQINYG